MIVEEIKQLRALIDEWYSNTEPHNRYDSDMYLECNERTNKILGEAMSLVLKGKEIEL